MAQGQHQAAFVPEVGKSLEIKSVSTKSPGADEVLIRTKAVAINPVDYYIQDTGLFFKTWPAVIGSDVSGEIVEVGDSVKSLKKGDRVLAAPYYLMSGRQEQAGFQELVVVPAIAVSVIPDSLSFADATVLPLSVSTAASGLYTKNFLNLPYPSTQPESTGKKIIIWGGSSSVGSSAVQLALASGLEVLVTASPKNFDYVKGLAQGGKIKVFDYNSPSIVGDLFDEIDGKPFVGAYDAIGTRDTQLALGTILAQAGGGKIASVLDPPKELPATVESGWVMAPHIFGEESKDVGEAVFGDFLPKALASGQFIAAPKHEVVGEGLESLQEGLKRQKAGVSAKKLVVVL